MRTSLRAALLALLPVLLLAACSLERPRQEGGLQVYFIVDLATASGEQTQAKEQWGDGSAIQSEDYTGDGTPGVEELMAALLRGPATEGLRSPIPAGVTLRSWALEEGVLTLDLSENYGDLAGVELTLADYCITLTLCQLEEAEAVEITAAGYALSYRSHQTLTPDEAVLTPDQDSGGEGDTP